MKALSLRQPWAWAVVLDNVEHTPIVPFAGMLGFFEVPDDVVARLR